MEKVPDPEFLSNFLSSHIDEIFKEFDKKEAETKEKHFVVISCADAKKYTGNLAGKAYQFSFHKLNSPVLRALNFESHETILDTKLNNDVCFVVADEKNKLAIIKYKREKSTSNK